MSKQDKQTEARCEICGVPGVAPMCADCQDAAVSIKATFGTVAVCWNCRHRIYAGARDSSLGVCDLTDRTTVRPDNLCGLHASIGMEEKIHPLDSRLHGNAEDREHVSTAAESRRLGRYIDETGDY